MNYSLSDDQLRMLRLRAQRLHPSDVLGEVAEVARATCGLQAQDEAAASLSLRARSRGLLASDVRQARERERSVVRTWCQRGTLHLLAAEDVHWLLMLLGPLFNQPSKRRSELGLDVETIARAADALRRLLAASGPLTRAEIVQRLAPAGFRLEGQAAAHLLHYAALSGVICQGPNRGARPTYVLLDDWIPPDRGLSEHAALGQLARRYLHAYAPAAPEDLAAWSGLPLGRARQAWQAIAGERVEVETTVGSRWLLRSQIHWLEQLSDGPPLVCLLPSFDTYLLGYRGRALIVPPVHASRIHPGGGLIHPTVLVDGRARARWRLHRHRNALELSVEPFDDLDPQIRAGVEAEARDLSRFLGLEQSPQVRYAA